MIRIVQTTNTYNSDLDSDNEVTSDKVGETLKDMYEYVDNEKDKSNNVGEEVDVSEELPDGENKNQQGKAEDLQEIYRYKNCSETLEWKTTLKKHDGGQHEGGIYSCNYCGYKLKKHNLKMHQRSVHEHVKYSSHGCNYEATQHGNLERHQQSVHEGVKYTCGECSYEALEPGTHKKHLYSVHDEINMPVINVNMNSLHEMVSRSSFNLFMRA